MQKRLPTRKRKQHLYVFFPLTCAFSLLLVLIGLRPNARPPPPKPRSACYGKYVYMHDLPTRFNTDMLEGCRTLSKWTDMCTYMSNAGLGPELDDRNMLPGRGWYATDQFALERIFHERMKGYKCLTNDSGLATALFVPFYAGLEVARHLWGYNVTLRDEAALDFAKWLRSRPEWSRMGGKDHFMVAGRITWDFRRHTDEDTNWGSKLLLLPETKNMSTLVLEASLWNENDIGIPYPTYFHPSEDSQLFKWMERVRNVERKWLFSFAGAPRPNQTQSIRGRVIHQCGSSNRCSLLRCDFGSSKCYSPASVMRLFENSTFCLQPQGDSYTRKSTFDSMVAGCIPVFFHPGSAYVQYRWHLPQEHSRYSVFISEDDIREGSGKNIEQVLAAIEEDRVKAMREVVINTLPKLIYIDPRANTNVTLKDAFDVTIEGVIARVERLKREVREGGDTRKFKEENSWKVDLVGNEEPHEWDRFFFRSKR